MESKTIIIGVIGSDVHAVGNQIMQYVLEREGFNIVNIGVLSTQEDFINAAIESNADAILISSLYGHGEMDCRGLRDKCNEAGLENILLYVGGNIVVGKQDFAAVEKKFKAMGYDRVYAPGTQIDVVIPTLKADLGVE